MTPKTSGCALEVLAGEPKRVQLSRRKGWRMPDNTVSVARPGRWGNPFKVEGERTAVSAVEAFRERMQHILSGPLGVSEAHALRHYLASKNLACWCALDQPCHADVLLELANDLPRARQATSAAIGGDPQPRDPSSYEKEADNG